MTTERPDQGRAGARPSRMMKRCSRWRNALPRVLLIACLAGAAVQAQEPDESPLMIEKTGERFTVVADGVQLSEIIRELRTHVDIDLKVPQKLLDTERTLNIENGTIEDVIGALAGGQALIYERWGDTYKLVSAQLTTEEEFIPPELGRLDREGRRDLAAKRDRVQGLLEEHRGIIDYAGELDYEQAKALIAERKTKMQAIIDALAALGPGGARAMGELYGDDDLAGTREKQAMVKALAKIDDPEASSVLASLYGDESAFSLQRDILGSLGRRKDAESTAALQNILASSGDIRVQAAAVQGLSGRAETLPMLQDIVTSPQQKEDVRMESIRSIGLMANQDAMQVLADAALMSGNRKVRTASIQELGRSYGDASLAVMATIMQSNDDYARYAAVKSLARLESNEARELLQKAAAEDPSDNVRAHAQAALGAE